MKQQFYLLYIFELFFMNQNTTLICLTPVKNESWILHRFLKSASLWADHIIIADQNSTDNSREITLQYPKVILIENNAKEYNELERQQLLINKSREIQGKRVIIALDTDEMLTSNFLTSPEWQTIINSPEGTIFQFQWVNILPDMQNYWLVEGKQLGYVDDGFVHQGIKIHSPRIPTSPNSSIIKLTEIKVLHYQYTDWLRMESKHRWYQCWERINNPSKSAIDLYRQYHHMYSIQKEDIFAIKSEWIQGYKDNGIDVTSTKIDAIYWWDIEVLKLFLEYGCKKFKKENIWYINWNEIYQKYLTMYSNSNNEIIISSGKSPIFDDPRNRLEKKVHNWLMKTQVNCNKSYETIENILKLLLGW